MELKKVDVKEFQKSLYKEYKKIFPSDERKSLGHIKKFFVRGNLEILEILDEDKIVGFFITNILKNNPLHNLLLTLILLNHYYYLNYLL